MINNLNERILQYGGSVHPLIISSELTQGLGLCNPSILVKDNTLYVNIRHVQYSLYHSENTQKFQCVWGPLSYLHPENDQTLTTKNFLCKLNPTTFEITSCNKIDTSLLDIQPIWEFVGLEDGRLVDWDNKLTLIGVRRDTTPNGVGRMEYSEILDNKEVSRIRIEPPGGSESSYCEKNWMPIIDIPHHFIKWTNPTEIVKANLETGTSETVYASRNQLQLPRDIRGGSQVIPYKGYHIALTHEVDLFFNENGGKDGQYYHRFIVWDKNWNIIKVSEEFKFFTANIEFGCGLAEYDGNLIATIGFQDSSAFIIKIPLDFIDEFLGLSNAKLDNFPVVNYISFEDEKERRSVLESQLMSYNLNYRPYITTKIMDQSSNITGQFINEMDTRGLYCAASHMRAIKSWYNETDEPYGFFVEDDISFETIDYWGFKWDSFMNNLPNNWDCVQMVIINEECRESFFQIQSRNVVDLWSVTGYIIRRDYAKKLIDRFHKADNFTFFLENTKLLPIVENIIYTTGQSYAFPLFIEQTDIISTAFKREYNIRYDEQIRVHNQNYHNACSEYILNWWKLNGKNLRFGKSTSITPYIISAHIKRPFDILTNFNLGEFYYTRGHLASALSFFLRAAEYGRDIVDDDIIYESLLKVAIILGKEGNRSSSEKGAYLNAISFQPNRPEGYYLLSQYYEYRKNWIDSFACANIGQANIKNKKPTLTNIGYPGDFIFKIQIAVSAWWIGRGKLSRELFLDIYNNNYGELDDNLKHLVHINLKQLGIGSDTFLNYDKSMYESIKFKFNGLETIERNYSETYQDMFVLTMLNGKRTGTYLEIGSADPYKGNNTVLLENNFGWVGVSIEILIDQVATFQSMRKNPIIHANALDLNYDNVLKALGFGSTVDYLQIDCESAETSYQILTKIPFDKYKFAVITFEHDYYNDLTKSVRDKSRRLLKAQGYVLVASDISQTDTTSYEDWWVNPELIDPNIIQIMTNDSNTPKRADKYMKNL